MILESEVTVLWHVAVAIALGAIVGIERQLSDRPAGLRTHMLVCGAAALLVSLGDAVVADFGGSDPSVRVDPIRVIEAVVAGVSFLGAGTIFRRGDRAGSVEGLTTAASLLFTAGVGVAVAADRLLLAGGATLMLTAVLYSSRWLEGREEK